MADVKAGIDHLERMLKCVCEGTSRDKKHSIPDMLDIGKSPYFFQTLNNSLALKNFQAFKNSSKLKSFLSQKLFRNNTLRVSLYEFSGSNTLKVSYYVGFHTCSNLKYLTLKVFNPKGLKFF